MHTNWQTFLTDKGARLNTLQQIEFDNEADVIARLTTSPVIISLDHLGVIRASGADAQTFLQGQLSNDIRALGQNRFQISAYCNPKGRMLAQFFIIPDGADFLLLLPRELLPATLQRLKMFVLRSQVTLDDVSADRVCLGLTNPDPQARAAIPLPDTEYALAGKPGVMAGRLPGLPERYLLVCTTDAARAVWSSLAPASLAGGPGVWHWLDIQTGMPSIWPQTREEFVPQMVNLELIQGVNFNKGCYPGQEIVARMHYLGTPKRRMYRLRLPDREQPVPGTDIYDVDGDGQSAGKVVLAQPGPQATELLASLQVSKSTAALRLGSADGPPLTLLELPYSLAITER